MRTLTGAGAFVAVVGASGVGKDSLLALARQRRGHLAHFPQRAITRPPGAEEESTHLDEEAFAAARARGDFAVSWHAHGLLYAIPASADDVVAAGGVVVANVSRAAITALRQRYDRVVLVRVTLSEAVRAQRLHARGREVGDDAARRLERADPAPHQRADHEICNDAALEDGAEELVRIIDAALSTTARSG